jgi:hypothetical protein
MFFFSCVGYSYNFCYFCYHICNKLLLSGILPCLKYYVIKHCLKKGVRNNICNYRPKSLLTSFSKVTEKVMHIRLPEHVNNNNILVEEQLGFRI